MPRSSVAARSIGAGLAPLLARRSAGTVLAAFERSAYLALDGRIIALVSAELQNGPLNVVLEPGAGFRAPAPGTRAAGDGSGIDVGDALRIDLRGAAIWDPRLPAGPFPSPVPLAVAGRTLLAHAPEGSAAGLLAIVESPEAGAVAALDAPRGRLFKGWSFLLEGLRLDDEATLRAAATRLAGLGSGLTPTGDDVLVGTMLAMHLAGRAAAPLAVAAERTTAVSAAYLLAAARGEASEAWHGLIAALRHAGGPEIGEAARRLMRFGETSGSDMLAGFLAACAALR